MKWIEKCRLGSSDAVSTLCLGTSRSSRRPLVNEDDGRVLPGELLVVQA
jgi:hypothetical protein